MTQSDELKGTSALVTGGGRGLGRVMTTALAAAGASVLVVDIDDEPLDEVRREVEGNIEVQRADISNEDDVAATIDRANALFGGIDVLVNNAGINLKTMGGPGALDATPPGVELAPAAVRRFFDVHVMGPFLFNRAVVPGMLERGFGRIVTVTTGLATMTRARSAPYGPMKAANEAFTACIAYDLADTPVTVNVLIPGGSVATRFAGGGSRPRTTGFVDAQVMGPPIVWLASRASDGVTAMRFIANRWDPTKEPAEAARVAGAPIGWPIGEAS